MQRELGIEVRDLVYRYSGAGEDVLRIPSLDIRGPGLVAVTGPSGAGKSTLIEIIAGTLQDEYSGTVKVLGGVWNEFSRDSDRQRHLRRIGLIPQDYGLLPTLTPIELLHQDLSDAGVARAGQDDRINVALTSVGLEEYAHVLISSLSGGQKQRVAIARMLARDVDLVVADEPTANLDPSLVQGVMRLFRELSESRLVVVISHDAAVAAACDRTIVLQSLVASRTQSAVASSERRTERKPRRWMLVPGTGLVVAVVAALILLYGGGHAKNARIQLTRSSSVNRAVTSKAKGAINSTKNAKASNDAQTASSPKATVPATTLPPSTTTTTLTSTVIQLYSPYDVNTLKPGYSFVAIASGSCWEGSVVDIANPSAWRCTIGNEILDPCFSNAAQSQVACPGASPTLMTVINLTQPLPSNLANATGRQGSSPFVWEIELPNAITCTYTSGTRATVDGVLLEGACSNSYGLIKVSTSGPLWQAQVLDESNKTIQTIPVAFAYE